MTAAETCVTCAEATGVTSAETCSVTSAETCSVPATETAAVTSAAALRPHRYRQEERERRDGHQAAHTRPL
jgi:hypothetical protein